MNRKVLVLIIGLALCLTGTNSVAQETLKGFDKKKDLPTLNKIIRRSARRLNAIEGGISLTTGVTGILPVANGGTGQNHSTNNQGDIYYDNGTDEFTRLTPGTSGQFLQTQGASANPKWTTGGMKLISTTTKTGAANSEDITIEVSKQYYVTFEIDNATNTDCRVEILFNSSTAGGTYAWSGEGRTMNTTSAVLTDGDESDTTIVLMDDGTEQYVKLMDTSGNNGFIRGTLFIDTNKISTVYSAFITGNFVGKDSDSALTTAVFGGVVTANLTITDFEFQLSQDVNMTIKLYELS